MEPERINELVSKILALLPPQADLMMRPLLTTNLTMIAESYSPEQAEAFANDIEGAANAYKNGNREEAAQYVTKWGFTLEMLEAMVGAPAA